MGMSPTNVRTLLSPIISMRQKVSLTCKWIRNIVLQVYDVNVTIACL